MLRVGMLFGVVKEAFINSSVYMDAG